MIEVFIAFTETTPMMLLRQTLEAWEKGGYDPVAIKVPEKKHELVRKVAAEGLAKGDYIVAELGSKPGKKIRLIKKGSDTSIKVEAGAVQ